MSAKTNIVVHRDSDLRIAVVVDVLPSMFAGRTMLPCSTAYPAI